MFFVRDADNSMYQEMVMVCCFFLAAVDLFWAWVWLDLEADWVRALPQLAAGVVSIYAAKIHIPSNILEDRRRACCYWSRMGWPFSSDLRFIQASNGLSIWPGLRCPRGFS
ncbi:unnamed protein product [Ectocarpus sp. CCAP 1310/34]|nr:unnamed protein product [Ectocarpus sp. CCAP 1310/34]